MLSYTLTGNFILDADSYKVGHLKHLPAGTLRSHSNIVARKPFVDEEHGVEINEVVVLGPEVVAQVLKSIKITDEMIDEAEIEITEQGYDFPRAEWEAIRDLGYLPLIVRAMPEGTVVPVGLPIMSVENTVDGFAWLPAYIETWAQDIVWTMSITASKVRYLRKQVDEFCENTGTPAEAAEFMIHNFGDRGAGGRDRAIMAGIAHALFFSGSDCLAANRYIKRLYNPVLPALSSVDANEHSVVCANSDCDNRDDSAAFQMTLETLDRAVERAGRGVGIPLISCLIDTFDDERYIKEFVIPNAKRIAESGGKYVCRPDSGNAITKPIEIAHLLLDGLTDSEGRGFNASGFATLPAYLGVIQGDGLKLWDFAKIFRLAEEDNLAASNFAFGFGGGMTNGSGRDDFSFSMKATALKNAEGVWVDMQKMPKTDTAKQSLKGRATVIASGGELVLGQNGDLNDEFHVIYRDGRAQSTTFDEVRKRARK